MRTPTRATATKANQNFLLTNKKKDDIIKSSKGTNKKFNSKKEVFIMTNMTYVSAVEYAIANIDNAEVTEKLSALRDSLVKRNSRKSEGMTKTQKENVAIKEAIVEALAESEGMTATEVANAVNISLAKATALLTQLVKADSVKREVEKKVAHFSV